MDTEWALDDQGQMPLLKIYTQICSIYSMFDGTSQQSVVETLNRGLERVAVSFPWTAGQVVTEGAGKGNSGTVKMKPLETSPRVVVKDLQNDPSAPITEALQSNNFPIRMLDEEVFCPRHTIPTGPGESPADPAPVFLVQATFICGGLVLAFVASHSATDVTGMDALIGLLDKACRGAQFTPAELDWGNRARNTVVPLLDEPYTPGPELDRQIVKPRPTDEPAAAGPSGAAPPKSSWTSFSLSASALEALKAQATATKPATTAFVSTDDALTAFIWKSIARARRPRLSADSSALLARAVDAWRPLGVPSAYPGLLQNMTYHPNVLFHLLRAPLGALAAGLRAGVDPATSDVAYRTRALATHLRAAPDKRDVSFTATVDAGCDLAVSSWAKLGLAARDFGLGLGAPVAVRRPRFAPVEGLVYVLPRAPDGSMTVAVGLRDADLERLKADEGFASYATHIG